MEKTQEQIAHDCHKLSVVSQLMIDSIDAVLPILEDKSAGKAFIEDCKRVQAGCEALLTNVYDIEAVYSSNYIIELTNKVDAVIEQNFISINSPLRSETNKL